MKNIKLKFKRLISFILAGVLISGVAYAAISNKIFMIGASFTTSNIEIRFLKNLSLGSSQENLTSEIQGVTFDNIYNYWTSDYLVKLTNNSASSVKVSSYANYSTAEDPASLRYSLFVELFPWNDKNSNGLVDEGELDTALGKKNFVKWKTEGFDLGNFDSKVIKAYVLRFSAEGITDTKIGQTGKFDFEFGVMQ
jgi:hypothetical protein